MAEEADILYRRLEKLEKLQKDTAWNEFLLLVAKEESGRYARWLCHGKDSEFMRGGNVVLRNLRGLLNKEIENIKQTLKDMEGGGDKDEE